MYSCIPRKFKHLAQLVVLLTVLSVISVPSIQTQETAFEVGNCPFSCRTTPLTPGRFCTPFIQYSSICGPSTQEAEDARHSAAQAMWNGNFTEGLIAGYPESMFEEVLNNECSNASKAMVCYHYFPRCVGPDNKVLGICASTCERYYRICGSRYLVNFRCVDSNVYRNSFSMENALCTGHGNSIFLSSSTFTIQFLTISLISSLIFFISSFTSLSS